MGCSHSEDETEECFRSHELTQWIDVHAYWNTTSEISRWKSGEHYPQKIQLPANLPEGPATLRWLWICKFTDEIFTSCIDVNIIGGVPTPTQDSTPVPSSTPTVAPVVPEPEPES